MDPAAGDAMGYKDKARALYTLKYLEGRDISYQFRVIRHYHMSAMKILRITKHEEKIKNITEAIEVFDHWLLDYEENDRGKFNWSYLPIETIEAFKPLAESYGILDTDFYDAYKKNNGVCKAMRITKTKDGTTTWDIERNARLRDIINNIKENNLGWYEPEGNAKKGYPTIEHIRCILLGYSPDPAKLKSLGSRISKTFQSSEKIGKMMSVTEEKNIKRTEETNVCKKNRELLSCKTDDSDENKEPPKKKPKKRPSVSPEKEEDPNGLMNFKDKEGALKSIKQLEGRDILYQYHTVNGFINRAKRFLSCTKDEEKIKNIEAAIELFRHWITDYNVTHPGNEHFIYLTLEILIAYKPFVEKYGLEIPQFFGAYHVIGGDYKKLQTVKVPDKNITWEIERNEHLRTIIERMKYDNKSWFEMNEPLCGLPTKEHMECIMWGYSQEPKKLKETLALLHEKLI